MFHLSVKVAKGMPWNTHKGEFPLEIIPTFGYDEP
jgi:hypothetical protein